MNFGAHGDFPYYLTFISVYICVVNFTRGSLETQTRELHPLVSVCIYFQTKYWFFLLNSHDFYRKQNKLSITTTVLVNLNLIKTRNQKKIHKNVYNPAKGIHPSWLNRRSGKLSFIISRLEIQKQCNRKKLHCNYKKNNKTFKFTYILRLFFLKENIKSMRKTLKVLQKDASDKENLVGRNVITSGEKSLYKKSKS